MAGDGDDSVEPSFHVGQRVMQVAGKDDKRPQLGTVMYVGDVDGYQGLWIGVDWDSGEGRHDGSLNGKRYFQASGSSSASFVRPHVITAGRSLLEAMVYKYKSESKDGDDDMYLLSVRQKRVSVEFVGREKIEKRLKHLEELTSASLIYEGVNSAGELENVLPNLKELELTGNLLSEFHTAYEICCQLPALRMLDLSRNRLKVNRVPVPTVHLQTLILNNCGLNWSQVELMKHSLPVLEELHLCGNKIKVIEVDGGEKYVDGFKSLRLLNFDGNCIEEWDEVLKLSKLESLEQLQVCYNKLKTIYYPDNTAQNDSQFRPFERLQCLLLAGNEIDNWTSFDVLNQFPNLKEVRLSDNPLTDLSSGGVPRYMLVARLGNISVLNGSEIRQRERKDSEIRYVHYVMSTMPTSDVEERVHVHPRFLKLKEFYDLDEEHHVVKKGTGSEKMASSLKAIKLECVAASVGEKAPVTKKLPLSTTVAKLKLICETLFKVKASKQRLYIREEDSPMPMPIGDDMETVADIGLGSGSTVLVDETGA